MDILTGVLIAGAYILGFLALAEWLRRHRQVPATFTRKLIHIGVGMLIWLVPFLFTTPWPFVGAALFFAVFNWFDWRHGLLAGMAAADERNLGTVYFPLVAAIVAVLLWSRPALLVAALMPLTWGDGVAPLAGRRWGRRSYTILGTRRTREGSLAFFVATAVSVGMALLFYPLPPDFTLDAALRMAVVVAAVTAIVEGLTPWGLDNITVTAAALALLAL